MKSSRNPSPKSFDVEPYREIVSELREEMDGKVFESRCRPIVLDILSSYEGFSSVQKGPDFQGTPFDFLGFKDGKPYIIEFKGSLDYFHTPGETQKKRLREILQTIEGLQVALLQVKVRKGLYRIF
jgi:hypothetical protein